MDLDGRPDAVEHQARLRSRRTGGLAAALVVLGVLGGLVALGQSDGRPSGTADPADPAGLGGTEPPPASHLAIATPSATTGSPPADDARYGPGDVLLVTGRELGDPYEAYPGDRLYVIEALNAPDGAMYRLELPSGAAAEDASYEVLPIELIERATEPVDDPCPAVPDTVSELVRVRPFERARCLAGELVTIRDVRVDRPVAGGATLGRQGVASMTPWPEPQRDSLPFSLVDGLTIDAPGWWTLTGRFGLDDETCGAAAGRLRCRERFVVDAVSPGSDPSALVAGTWTRMTDAPIAGRSDNVALPVDGRAFIWGGWPDDAANEGAIYDPATDRWTTIEPAPGPKRLRPAAAWTGHEVLMWGGVGGDVGGLRYDPATDRWTPIPEAPVAGGRSIGAWTGDRFVVVDERMQTAAWDPRSDDWERLPDAPLPAGYQEGVWTGRELIVLAFMEGGNDPLVGAAYSPQLGSWRRIAEVPYDGLSLGWAPIWTGTEMLFAFHAYDPARDRWRVLEMEGCDLYRGLGGVWTGRLVLSQVTAYDPASGRCGRLPEAPVRTGYDGLEPIRTHEFHAPVWVDGRLIVWSGFTGLDGPPPNPDGVMFRPATP